MTQDTAADTNLKDLALGESDVPKIVFIAHDGTERVLEGTVGRSIMQTAVDNMVTEIVGECGGCCSCATCHAYIDPTWRDRLPAMDDEEAAMLEGAIDVTGNSRLTCQITVLEDMDGIVVRTPKSQF
jgi:2Fe-2S ferredoxin